MKENKVSRRVTFTILSISLLTVMAGAAIAPALGIIRSHFSNASSLLVQLIVSLPALFIIVTNIFFPKISRRFNTRTIALVGLMVYVVAGGGCFFAGNIVAILVLRALLGVSVGLIMPLSTGLLALYYPPEKQARLMGLAAAMNQLGGVVATLLAGVLAMVEWNYAFLVYLLGLIALVMVWLWLPGGRADSSNKHREVFRPRHLLRFHSSVVGMLLLMVSFFIFPANFALTASRHVGLPTSVVTIIMVGLDVVAFFVGLCFGRLMKSCRKQMKYFSPVGFIMGYSAFIIPCLPMYVAGMVLVGVAVGVGVPYLNTIASIKAGRNSATTVMPLLSAALYLGQFVSPLIVALMSGVLFPSSDIAAPYKTGVFIGVVFLLQVYATRRFQSLPPSEP